MPRDVETGQESQTDKLKYNRYNFYCDGRIWCIRDFAGGSCVLIAFILIGYAVFVVVYIIIIPSSCWIFKICNSIAYLAVVVMAISSHFRAMFTDPGAVPVVENPVFHKDAKLCAKCGCVKPPKAHHCSVCRRCIRKMDHHCPWMNNCVGEDNLKFFILYNFYIALLCCYTMILLSFKMVELMRDGWPTGKKSSAFQLIAITVGLVEALAFSIFTIGIGTSQIINIVNDTTYIEKLQKNDVPGTESKCEYYRDVFGESFFKWFSPFTKIKSES